jgi:amino acid permease
MARIELPRFQVLIDESYGTSEESSRVVTPRDNNVNRTNTSSVFGSVVTLCAAAVGVGVVALPFAFSLIGLWGGVICIFFFAILTTVNLVWLLECSQLSKKLTFEGNVKFFLGDLGDRFLSINLVFLLFGGSVAMFVVSVSTMRAIWDSYLVDVAIISSSIVVCLLVMGDPVKRLGFTSFFAVACIMHICVLMGLQWYQRVDNASARDKCLEQLDSGLVTDLITASSIILNSFIMNFIFFEIVASIPRGPTLPVRVKRIVYLAIGFVIVPLYIFIGFSGLYGLGNCGQVSSNIFASDMWSINPFLVNSGRISLSLLNIFKFPLLMLPLCHTVFPKADGNRHTQICIMFPIVAGVSYLFRDISQVLNWIGTTCGISLGFIIPAAMYYRLQDIEGEQADLAQRIMTYHQSLPETEPVTPSASSRAKSRNLKKTICSGLIIASFVYAISGIVVDVNSTTATRGLILFTYDRTR